MGSATSGAFSINLSSPSQLSGVLRLVPAAGTETTAVQVASPVCHDIATLLPERLPLATPVPDSCAADAEPSVVSALSTLLTTGVEMSSETLRQALALPGSSTIGRYNAFQVIASLFTVFCVYVWRFMLESLIPQLLAPPPFPAPSAGCSGRRRRRKGHHEG